uniref:Uncharacterized protein n=1 Tax=Arundo donax TaxID=35708 RepID=A0A0A8YI75_ARUDO
MDCMPAPLGAEGESDMGGRLNTLQCLLAQAGDQRPQTSTEIVAGIKASLLHTGQTTKSIVS